MKTIWTSKVSKKDISDYEQKLSKEDYNAVTYKAKVDNYIASIKNKKKHMLVEALMRFYQEYGVENSIRVTKRNKLILEVDDTVTDINSIRTYGLYKAIHQSVGYFREYSIRLDEKNGRLILERVISESKKEQFTITRTLTGINEGVIENIGFEFAECFLESNK